MANRRWVPGTGTLPPPAIIRCSCSINFAIWNAAPCARAIFTAPTDGTLCSSLSWRGIKVKSRAFIFVPTPASPIPGCTNIWRLNGSNTPFDFRRTASFKSGSAICSNVRLVARPMTCADLTRTSPIRPEAGTSRAGWLPRSNGIRANSIRASASSSPTCRDPPRMSSPSTTSAGRASNDGVDGPRRHRLCQNEVVADLRQWRPPVEQISRIGMDTSKHFFQLHGVNAAEKVVLRKKLRRKEMVAFFKALAPTVIGIEACGAAHYLARLLGSFGHEVKLIAPQLVKPYVKRGKNDGADAEALCEAMSRPSMRFVPVKTAEQQAALMMVGLRDRLIRNRTQLSNAIRGYAAEFGFSPAKGKAHLVPLLERIQADESVPVLARELFTAQAEEYARLQAQIDAVDVKLLAWHKANECSRRLAKIPGVGPIGAVLLMLKTPAPELFRSGRQFAAWIGLTPKDHSTAGKVRLGGITRAGDEALRSVLVVGATS